MQYHHHRTTQKVSEGLTPITSDSGDQVRGPAMVGMGWFMGQLDATPEPIAWKTKHQPLRSVLPSTSVREGET